MLIVASTWLMATLCVAASAVVLAKRLYPTPGSFIVVHSIVIVWVWIIVVAISLSIANRLTGPALMVGVLIVALASAFVCTRWKGAAGRREITTTGELSFWPATFWISLLCFWTGHVVSGGLLKFNTDFDSLMYHIPLVDSWVQARSLYAPASGHWSNPGSNELFSFWIAAPFPNDCLVLLGNIPAALLLSFGSFQLGRLMGLSPIVNYSTTFAIVSNFVVMKQLNDAENDMAVAALFTTCLCYGVKASRGDTIAVSFVGPASLGILCGVKYYALGLAAVAWTFAVLLSWMSRDFRAGARVALSWGIGSILIGGPWYARNMLVSGSPFYPLVKGTGDAAFVMGYPDPLGTTFFGNGRPEIWPLALDAVWKMTGPCQMFSIYSLPMIIVGFFFIGIKSIRIGHRNSLDRMALAFAIIGSAAVLGVTPMALEDIPGTLNHLKWSYTPVRYGFGFISISTIGMSLLYCDFAKFVCYRYFNKIIYTILMKIMGYTIGLCGIFQLANLNPEIEVDWNLTICISVNIGFIILLICMFFRVKIILIYLIPFVVLLMAFGIEAASDSWDNQFTKFYEAYYQTESLTKMYSLPGKVKRVAYYDYRCYPFFGARREFFLCQERSVDSYEKLLSYINSMKLDYLIVRSDKHVKGYDNFGSVKHWLEDHREIFRLVHFDKTHAIFEIVQPAIRLSTPSNAAGS